MPGNGYYMFPGGFFIENKSGMLFIILIDPVRSKLVSDRLYNGINLKHKL